MSDIPQGLKYAITHEWASRDGEDVITVGITDHAQRALGDVVYVELPEVGKQVMVGKEFGVIESVKAASDLYSPVTGQIVAINADLHHNPALVNNAPYQGGWLVKIQCDVLKDWDALLDPDAYAATIADDDN